MGDMRYLNYLNVMLLKHEEKTNNLFFMCVIDIYIYIATILYYLTMSLSKDLTIQCYSRSM